MEAPVTPAPARAFAVSSPAVTISRSTIAATLIATVAGVGLQVVAVRQARLVLPAGLLAGAFPALSLLIRDGVGTVVPALAAAGVAFLAWLPFALAGAVGWGSVAMTVSYPLAVLACAAASERFRLRRGEPALPAAG